MPKKVFDEAELYLINNWRASTRLRDCMDGVYQKLGGILEAVIDKAEEAHEELNYKFSHPKDDGGCIYMGRQSWPREGWASGPSGLYLTDIGIDSLTSEDHDRPCGGIYFNLAAQSPDLEPAKKKIEAAARELLRDEGFKWTPRDDKYVRYSVWYCFPKPRHELLAMLLDRAAEPFIEYLVSQVDILARFIPVLDEVFSKKKSR